MRSRAVFGPMVALLCLGVPAVSGAATLRVRAGATGANDGSSWANAYASLQSALAAATPGSQIWIAEGTYKPTTGSNRNASFNLVDAVEVYGGFAGTESLLSERQSAFHLTVLSGDLGVAGDSTDNSYHVVTAGPGVTASAVLDGVTITGGNADDTTPNISGGGLWCQSSATPSIWRVTFLRNHASYGGGALLCGSLVGSTLFDGNSAYQGGGAMTTGSGNLLVNVRFTRNQATLSGGGIEVAGTDARIENGVFTQNVAAEGGGVSLLAPATLDHLSFGGNQAPVGGALTMRLGAFTVATLSNSLLWGDDPNEVDRQSGVLNVARSIIEGSGGSTGWLSMIGTDLGNNLDVDPGYADPRLGNLRVLLGSPAIDSGTSTDGSITTDPDGNARTNGSAIDRGAYEFVPGIVTTPCRFATAVAAVSSQLAGSAQQVLGVPDVYPTYGDSNLAWSSATPDGGPEFLELTYADPQPINYVDVYENLNPGVGSPGTELEFAL